MTHQHCHYYNETGNRIKRLMMRSVLIISLMLVTGLISQSVCSTAYANALIGYAPRESKSTLQFGQGIWYAEQAFIVHAKADESSPALMDIRWARGANAASLMVRDEITHQSLPASQLFLSFYPALEFALMAVVSETDSGWLELVINQKTGSTGWVKQHAVVKPGFLPPIGSSQSWYEFMMTHAKTAGVRWMNGVADSIKALHSQPDDMAKQIPSFYMQKLKVLHVKGNWMLMQGLDLERNNPIGWVRWREDNGQLLLFPNVEIPDDPWFAAHSKSS